MSDKYLISTTVNGVMEYFTANGDGSLKSIGSVIDWSQGFSEATLANINNSIYSTLENGKLYVNSTTHKTASVDTTGEGLLWTSEATEISTKGYSAVTSISANGNANCRYAVSFDGTNSYMTRGTGLIPSTSVAIPTTNTARTTAGVSIKTVYTDESNNNLVEKVFDGDDTTTFAMESYMQNIDVEFTTATRLLRHIIKIDSSSRLPVKVTFKGYNDSTLAFEDLDEITIYSAKDLDRTFENDKDRHLYRWTFTYNKDAIGDDPTKKITIKELNAYGSVSGDTWLKCAPGEVKSKGMNATQLAAVSATQYAEIFKQGNLNLITYIPNGGNFTNFNVTFPLNAAPIIDDFVPSHNTFHSEDIDLRFTIKDPEGTKCKYKLYINGNLYPDDTAGWTDVTDTDGIVTIKGIDNLLFNMVPGSNNVKIVASDEDDIQTEQTFSLNKKDELPTLVGSFDEDTYTFTITDADPPDKVKYTAWLINDKHPAPGIEIGTAEYMNNPSKGNVINIPPAYISIGKNNDLKIKLSDSVGGINEFTESFIGDYFGLMFTDSTGDYLSSDIGEVLKMLDFGTVTGGTTSDAIVVTACNKSKYKYIGPTIKVPIEGIDSGYENRWLPVKNSSNQRIFFDKNGNEVTDIAKVTGDYYPDENGNPVKFGTKGIVYDNNHPGCKMILEKVHCDGTTFAQLSKDDLFTDPSVFYSLPLKSPITKTNEMAPGEKIEFYVRINATSYFIRVASPQFATTGSASYSV